MAHCEDCGTRLSSGLCPNCQEEAVIYRDQGSEYIADGNHFSEQFMAKVAEQENRRN